MNTENPKNRRMGIALRTALLSWLVTIATVLIFVIVIIPMQKRIFLENLESKARGLAASLHNVAGGATVNEDFSSVVDHCKDMLDGDKALDYLVITKNDGFSLINDRSGWRSEPNASKDWRPDVRQPVSGLGVVSLFQRRVFHYSQPFDYSGIQWGWIHVGLSLDSYDHSVATVYQRTGMLAIVCIVISLLASLVYAKHLVRPILNLRQVVRQVASGNLVVRADVDRGDELGSLAGSVNTMTESLRRRDMILESMRFAAQKFLSTARWETVVGEVLAKIGTADEASRVHVLQKEMQADGKIQLKEVSVWESASCPKPVGEARQHTLVLLGTELGAFIPPLELGQTLTETQSGTSDAAVNLLRARQVKGFMLVPIMVEHSWWGVFSLVDCVKKREWTASEKDSFRAIADMFGAAIERQQIQNALVQAKETAEAASQAKSQFLANMSHEIRTPITGVMGMLQLLQRTSLDKSQARYAANASASAQALLAVIGDVLDFSKIEAGKMELDEHPFNSAELVDTVARLFAERAEGKEIELVYRVGSKVPKQLRGDSNRLRQILVNLVGNAVKFTSGGEVVLTCDAESFAADTTTLRFEIRDSGCGIAPEKQKLIFDAFSQADNSMARKYGGTGLGLTISRQFCELMGGSISVQSVPGQGSTFVVTLPFKNAPAEMAPAEDQLQDLRKLRVLVVDDCAITRAINREWITTWQGEADDAPDAEPALEKLRGAARRGQPFQVAVLDWKMPGTDGVSLARLIKNDPELKKVGLVFLSSFTQQSSYETIRAAGFAAFVPKPASKSDLYDAIITAANGEFRKAQAAALQPVPRASVCPIAFTGTVLLAEDNDINREVAVEMLASLGCQCRSVRNGHEAVALCQRNEVDLVLMDCQMPEMDGYEAARAIRAEEAARADRRRIPIVALTAHAAKGDRDYCLEAGMDDYLTKPLDPQTLAAMLGKWLLPKTAAKRKQADTLETGPIDYPGLLRRCMGKRELAARLVRKLAEQAEQDVQTILKASQDGDATALADTAHRLRGAAANVSATALSHIAGNLETLARSGNLTDSKAQLGKLRTEFLRLKSFSESSLRPNAVQTQPQTDAA